MSPNVEPISSINLTDRQKMILREIKKWKDKGIWLNRLHNSLKKEMAKGTLIKEIDYLEKNGIIESETVGTSRVLRVKRKEKTQKEDSKADSKKIQPDMSELVFRNMSEIEDRNLDIEKAFSDMEGVVTADNNLLKKTMKDFENQSNDDVRRVLAGKLYDIGSGMIIIYPPIVDFMVYHIPKSDKYTRRSLIKLLSNIVVTSIKLNFKSMKRKFALLRDEKFLEKLAGYVEDSSEEDTSSYYSAELLIYLNPEKAISPLFNRIRTGRKFVHDEGLIQLGLDLYKRLPEKKKHLVNKECVEIISGTYAEPRKLIAKGIMGRAGI